MGRHSHEARDKKEREAILHARWERRNREDTETRALFEAVPDSPEKLALKLAMLERAWWLLDAREGEGDAESRVYQADAVLAFLPGADAQKLLEEFFDTDHQFDPELYGAPIKKREVETV